MYIVLNTSGDTLSTSVRGVYRVWKCCYANILHTYFQENTSKSDNIDKNSKISILDRQF